MTCETCNGQGFIGLWVGRGGAERFEGDVEVCWTCGGYGEVEDMDEEAEDA